jgi:hypothetical protein
VDYRRAERVAEFAWPGAGGMTELAAPAQFGKHRIPPWRRYQRGLTVEAL